MTATTLFAGSSFAFQEQLHPAPNLSLENEAIPVFISIGSGCLTNGAVEVESAVSDLWNPATSGLTIHPSASTRPASHLFCVTIYWIGAECSTNRSVCPLAQCCLDNMSVVPFPFSPQEAQDWIYMPAAMFENHHRNHNGYTSFPGPFVRIFFIIFSTCLKASDNREPTITKSLDDERSSLMTYQKSESLECFISPAARPALLENGFHSSLTVWAS